MGLVSSPMAQLRMRKSANSPRLSEYATVQARVWVVV